MLAGSLDQQLRHVPKVFMEPMFRYLNEERDIEVITVDFQAISDLPQPSDSELEAFYTQHKQFFFAPETRSFNMLLLSFHEIAQAINVSNDDLLQLYKQSDNKVPEKRSVRFIPFRSREEAIKAKEELSSGAPFAVVYSRYTGDTPENAPQPQELELKQLRPEVGSEVFSMKRIHDVSDLIFLGNQYFLFVLTDIKPAKTLSFEEQKFALLKKYKTDIAREKMYDYTQRAEKMLASGAKLSDVSDSFNKEGIPGMVMVTWDKVTQDGKTIDGEPVTGIVAFDPKVLTTAFDTPQYTYSDPQKLATEDYVIIEVNDVKPAHQRSFAEALKQVQRYWQAEQKRIQAQHHIETIKQGIERFEDVGKLASANFGRVDVLNRVTRANTPKNPQFAGVLNQLNALKSEGIAMDVAANRIQIARVIGAYPVNMDAFKTSAPVFAHKVMIPLLSRDLLSSYIAALEAYFPVVRNEGYFKNFFGKEDLDNAPLPTAPDI
jgi:peptidyl-prolyl cis-trans isomerase D